MLTSGLLLLALATSSKSQEADAGCEPAELGEFKLGIGVKAAQLGSHAPVYRVTTPEITPTHAQEVAKRLFGLEGKAVKKGDMLLILTDHFWFSMDGKGAWRWADLDFMDGRISRKAPLPSGDEARIIADAWLKERGAFPADARFLGAKAQAGRVTVSYERVLDNIPHRGPGARLLVDVGSNSQVVTCIQAWPELVSMGERPLVGLHRAAARVRDGKAILLTQVAGPLTEPKLVYACPPEKLAYIRPHACFNVGDGPGQVLIDLLPDMVNLE
ncbi:MAG: hypothetical protein AAF533_16950 [Acidobacteriota bacterium]